jgi:hypothetical protein
VAKPGERIDARAAEWSEIDQDSRVRLPHEVTAVVSWYITGSAVDVLLEMRDDGVVLVHPASRRREVEERRQALISEFNDRVEGLRRAAISCAVFRPAAIGKGNRRITLQTSVLQHLGVTKPARVLCLAYADRIEILSETKAKELIMASRADIMLEDVNEDQEQRG